MLSRAIIRAPMVTTMCEFIRWDYGLWSSMPKSWATDGLSPRFNASWLTQQNFGKAMAPVCPHIAPMVGMIFLILTCDD